MFDENDVLCLCFGSVFECMNGCLRRASKENDECTFFKQRADVCLQEIDG